MDSNEYLEYASRTNTIDDTRRAALMGALGLTGEAGEVADLIKKWEFQGHFLNVEKLIEELGDTLWYVAVLCKTFDFTFSDIFETNVAKLLKRYPDGFTYEASLERADEKVS